MLKKKILLYGRLNESTKRIYTKLSKLCETQLCYGDIAVVDKMVDIVGPQVLIISTLGDGKAYTDIIGSVLKAAGSLKVAVLCESDMPEYEAFRSDRRFFVIPDQSSLRQLTDRCTEWLHLAPKASKGSKKRILVVDDSTLQQQKIKLLLKDKYDVGAASTVKSALASIAKQRPDLILLDYQLQEGNGYDLFRELSVDTDYDSIPVVFLTALADSATIKKIFRYRPEGYLLKPVDREALIETIDKAIERPANITSDELKD